MTNQKKPKRKPSQRSPSKTRKTGPRAEARARKCEMPSSGGARARSAYKRVTKSTCDKKKKKNSRGNNHGVTSSRATTGANATTPPCSVVATTTENDDEGPAKNITVKKTTLFFVFSF